MEDVKRILVVSSMTKSSRKAIHYGVSLSLLHKSDQERIKNVCATGDEIEEP